MELHMQQSLQLWRSVLKNLELSNNLQFYNFYEQISPSKLSDYSYRAIDQDCRRSPEQAMQLPSHSASTESQDSLTPLDLSRKSVASSPDNYFTSNNSTRSSPSSTDSSDLLVGRPSDVPLDLSCTSNTYKRKRQTAQLTPDQPSVKRSRNFLIELGLQQVHRSSEMEENKECSTILIESDECSPASNYVSTDLQQSPKPSNARSDMRHDISESASTEKSQQRDSSPASTSNRFHCSLCTSSFLDELSYTRHMTLHTTKLYNCYMCGRAYKQARDYRAHIAAHQNGSIYKCDICASVLSTASDYLQHLKTHRQKDLLSCSHCSRYFRDSCTLSTHMRTHTGEKPYQCEVCSKEFRQSGTYHRHRKVHDEEAMTKKRRVRIPVAAN